MKTKVNFRNHLVNTIGQYLSLLYHEVYSKARIGLEQITCPFLEIVINIRWGILTTAGCLLTEMTQTSQ